MSEDKRWVPVDPRSPGRQYQKPYDECPHCSKYRYSTHRVLTGFPFLGRSWTEWEECKNCGYTVDDPY